MGINPPIVGTEYPRLRQGGAGLDGLAPLWVTPDDLLMVGIRNSLAGVQVSLEGRLWLPDGMFSDPSQQVSPPSDSTLNFTSINLDYGYLVSAGVQAIGSTLPRRAQTYCTLMVVRPPKATFRLNHPLTAGYISGSQFLAWPGGKQQDSTDGMGFLSSTAITSPAAGVDFSVTVTTNQRWRIRGLGAQLLTSAAVATRRANLIIDDGANTLYNINTTVTQLAGLTNVYQWIPGFTGAAALIDQIDTFLTADLMLFSGWRLRSQTDNLQGADQWSAIRMIVEQWLED